MQYSLLKVLELLNNTGTRTGKSRPTAAGIDLSFSRALSGARLIIFQYCTRAKLRRGIAKRFPPIALDFSRSIHPEHLFSISTRRWNEDNTFSLFQVMRTLSIHSTLPSRRVSLSRTRRFRIKEDRSRISLLENADVINQDFLCSPVPTSCLVKYNSLVF